MRRLLGFGRKPPPAPEGPAPSIPPGLRVYAIGDVHGRFDLLARLLARIEADDAGRTPAESHIVLLGDLIDRGPESRAVIDHLLHHQPAFATFHFVMGNHEEMLLRFADDPDATGMEQFLRYGGRETFESYDVPQRMLDLPDYYTNADLVGFIPAEHLDFLRAGRHGIRFGDYFFAHAGIRPGVPIEEQAESDLRWIRGDFLTSEADHGVTVVHGHTVVRTPDVRTNRIGIDTGAYATGILTALGLEGTERWWLNTDEAA
ncbi:metallophosphoesterase family protein [Sphingomonas sp.]|uniref:metallophosphoesterase family protein n=1 Tax=Sphingomonas sp. TaxID=28214 RepID=UPI003B3BE816